MKSNITLWAATIALIFATSNPAAQERSSQLRKVPADSTLRPTCLPYRKTVTIQLPVGYSGVAGSFDFGNSRHLRLDSVTAHLHQSGFRGADLGGYTNGAFGWHVLRVEGDRAMYNAARDAAIYFDRAKPGKVVIYRTGSNAVGSGEFTVTGCLVSAIPQRLRKPDAQNPRLPPKVLLPGDKLKLDVVPIRDAPGR